MEIYKRVALLGEIGNPNVGDEAVLETNIQKIEKMYGNHCEIYILTKDASYTSMVCNRLHKNIVVVDYLHQFTVKCHYDIHLMKEKENCLFTDVDEFELQRSFLHQLFSGIDVLHIIGGGYINSLFPDMMYEVCLAIKFCKLYKVHYCFTGISVFPFDSQYLCDLEEAFDGADFIDFRDSSYKYLGMKNDSCFTQTVDDAVSMESIPVHLQSNRYATIVLHEWKNNTILIKDAIRNEIIPFMKKCIRDNVVNYFYVLGFSYGDIEVWEGIDELDKLCEYISFKMCFLEGEICEAKYIVENALFNIGSRFHQAVFSLSSGVPVLSVAFDPYYQNKLTSIHRNFGVNNVVNIESITMEQLNTFINNLSVHKNNILNAQSKVKELISQKNELLEKCYGKHIDESYKEVNKEPAISVIIPIYNMEKYLKECLNSVVNQTLKNIEIICVNDGSVDGSQGIIEQYSANDSRFKYFYHENHGVSYTRNIGIQNATGEYLYFLDPDDMVPDKNVFMDLYNAAKENHVNVCGGSFSELWPDRIVDQWENQFVKYGFKSDGIVEYKDYQYDFGWTRFIYNRNFLKEKNLNIPNLTYFEDPIFFVRAMHEAKQFYSLKRHTYLYRLGHKEFNMSYKQVVDFIAGINMNLCFAKEHGYEELYALEMYRLQHDYGKHILKYLTDQTSTELRDELKKLNHDLGFSENYIEYSIINSLLKNN